MVLACKIAEKAVTSDHRIFVHAADATQARRLDDLMWTFRDGSFLPHVIVETTPEDTRQDRHPVSIGFGCEPGAHCDLLINLAADVPDFFSRFKRVAELVDPDTRAAGRERFRFYRDRGYDMITHKL